MIVTVFDLLEIQIWILSHVINILMQLCASLNKYMQVCKARLTVTRTFTFSGVIDALVENSLNRCFQILKAF